MRRSHQILLLLAQILAANIASAESRNPCASAVADYCSGETGPALHSCLARKRQRIEENCVEAIELYYEQHPDEVMPEPEESDLKNEKTRVKVRTPGLHFYWSNPNERRKPQSESIIVQPSTEGIPQTPQVDPFDPYSNLREQIREYYAPEGSP